MIRRVSVKDSELLQAGYRVGSLTDCLQGIQSAIGKHVKPFSTEIVHDKGKVQVTFSCDPFSKRQLAFLNEPLWSHLAACSTSISILAESTERAEATLIVWPGGKCIQLARSHHKSVIKIEIVGLYAQLPVRQARLSDSSEWSQAIAQLNGKVYYHGKLVAKEEQISEPNTKSEKRPFVTMLGPQLSMPPPSAIKLSQCQVRSWKSSDELICRETVQLDPSGLSYLLIIGQFNREFIVCLHPQRRIIWLFDQHAIHERIRLERLTIGEFSRNQDEACHGAIKFGQRLSLKEMQSLMADLSHCKHPFICAHGRPSCYPIVKLPHYYSQMRIREVGPIGSRRKIILA